MANMADGKGGSAGDASVYVRLALVAVAGSWLVGSGEASAQSLFALVAAAMLAYGLVTVWAVKCTPWGPRG